MIVYNRIGDTDPRGDSASQLATFDVVHPATLDVVHRVQRSTSDDIARAVDTCWSAREAWSSTAVETRAAVVNKAADLLADESGGWSEKLQKANLAETSATLWWAKQQLADVVNFLRCLAEAAPRVFKTQIIQDESWTTHIEREPWGVCLAIPAWNAVHLLTARAIVTPLLAGNTVVLKTSEIAPQTQSLWGDLLYASGLPKGCLSVAHVAPQDAPSLLPQLVADTRIRHVNFTGSTRVGSILAAQAGQHLKPVLAELGGKAPVLLLPDANIDVAASHILFGSWMNAGQICMSTERIFVPRSRYESLCCALRSAWASVSHKSPRALYSKASGDRVRALIQGALRQGAEAIIEQTPEILDDAFVCPTILGQGTTDMALYREESFGPVAVVIAVPDEQCSEAEVVDKMVALANDTEYGLSAAVWSSDNSKARAVAKRLEAGAVHINGPTCHDLPRIPHGGWKSSGWGRFNGEEGIQAFTQIRTIELSNNEPKPLPLSLFEL